MDTKLIELSTNKLLEKFGAGNHKPGSGSAAAFQGMLSTQLLRTVIDLTNDEKRRRNYSNWLPEMLRIASEIDKRIYPALEELFQKDSEQFDKTIKLRNARDEEQDPLRKCQLAMEALKELKPATVLPIEIAKLCIELAEFAAFVFDHGFKSAKGDAGVALNGAISAAGGCLSIIHLNLLWFGSDDWTDHIRRQTSALRIRYDQLFPEAIDRVNALQKESERNNLFHLEINSLLSSLPDETRLTNSDIEEVARRLQNMMWTYKDVIWKHELPDDPIKALKPDVMLKKIGYEFYKSQSLGQHEINGEFFEIAGLIDKEHKMVEVSKQFPRETQNFTVAHELGHALFHKQTILHRDKAIDGSGLHTPLNRVEFQANKFAAFFLMPERQIKIVFENLFSIKKFIPTENTVFALTYGSVSDFRKNFKTMRDVSRFLASPIAQMFDVSVETMAIRLEELDLIEF